VAAIVGGCTADGNALGADRALNFRECTIASIPISDTVCFTRSCHCGRDSLVPSTAALSIGNREIAMT